MNYIIPTLGRNTLGRAVKSIIDEDKSANIIVMGNGKSAGENRNIAISKLDPTHKWTLFIDDDDYYESGYLSQLNDEYDMVVFRAKIGPNWVQPPYGEVGLHMNRVGIHFAIKTEFLMKSDIQFDSGSSAEDWRFLEKILDLNPKYVVTDEVYYIAPIPQHQIKKNVVFIPAYNGIKKDYKVAIHSWEHYCKRHNLELYLLDGDFSESKDKLPIWERFFDETIFSKNFDRMLMVDLDTIIRWDAPNIFDEYRDITVGVVRDAGGASSGLYHLRQWTDFDKGIVSKPQDYFNMGMLLITKTNFTKLVNELKPYYEYYISVRDTKRIDAFDQTAVNIVVDKLFPEAVRLPYIWNNMVMCKYEDFSFVNDSYMWHFTGAKMGGWANRINLMKTLWGHIHPYYLQK
jgi:glycosyltransferase involved in cell wall biosynthesis